METTTGNAGIATTSLPTSLLVSSLWGKQQTPLFTVKRNPIHCHLPSHTEVLKSTALSNIKFDATTATPGNFLKAVLTTTPADVKVVFPSAYTSSRNVIDATALNYNLHHAFLRLRPTSYVVIPEEYTIDAFSNLFLQLDTTSSGGHRALLFSTEIALNATNTSTVHIIFFDGTFKIAPSQLTQLWVIRGHLPHNTVLPIAYALLENKRHTS